MSYAIVSNDFRRAGAASRSIKEHLKRVGADAEAVRRTMIAAYEAEMNVVIHSAGGRLEACLADSRIDVDVLDEGPGIPDVEQAMVSGFSTAGPEARALGFGAGMGLPNIKRNSDRLRVTSRVGEGTRVSFTIRLKPETAGGGRLLAAASLYASAEKCRDCRACLAACPTQAMRVRDARPGVLEHLCIECTNCIGACTSNALSTREEIASLEQLESRDEMLLVVPPALLAGCGPDFGPAQVMSALQCLGFAGVVTSAPFERALLEAAAGGVESDAAAAAKRMARAPVIVPGCPAVVDLIELRFPSLVPNLAPFDSPWEAIEAAYGDRPAAYVVSCPAQRSALLAHARPDVRAEYLSPEVVRQAVMALLTCRVPVGGAASGGAAVGGAAQSGAKPDGALGDERAATGAVPRGKGPTAPDVLTVTGARHVTSILEALEDGLLEDVAVVDPYACEGGCFGSPLLAEDYHVAARRYRRGDQVAAEVAAHAGPRAPGAVLRRIPYVPRPGIRLDADMGRAIEKLAALQRVLQELPGRDCGACGAPTCASQAEDVVMGRAAADLCPYASTSSPDEEA